MIDFDNDDGADVLVVFNGEAQAVWIDGERVYYHDDLYRSNFMHLIEENTDGVLASYDEKEAVLNARTEDYIPRNDIPVELEDIVFADQVTTISISSSADLPQLENFNQGEGEYLIVQNRTGAFENKFLRRIAPDDVEIFHIQNR